MSCPAICHDPSCHTMREHPCHDGGCEATICKHCRRPEGEHPRVCPEQKVERPAPPSPRFIAEGDVSPPRPPPPPLMEIKEGALRPERPRPPRPEYIQDGKIPLQTEGGRAEAERLEIERIRCAAVHRARWGRDMALTSAIMCASIAMMELCARAEGKAAALQVFYGEVLPVVLLVFMAATLFRLGVYWTDLADLRERKKPRAATPG